MTPEEQIAVLQRQILDLADRVARIEARPAQTVGHPVHLGLPMQAPFVPPGQIGTPVWIGGPMAVPTNIALTPGTATT